MKTILVQKNVLTTVDATDLIPYGEWDGHHNHMPTPYKEITRDEYHHHVNSALAKYEWNQYILDIPNFSGSICFKLVGANVYGYSHPSSWRVANKEEIQNGAYGIIYTEEPRYFKIGCNHTYSSKNVGNCLNKLTCSKCGHSHTVDSSG
jgi:hypothetical protein